jgi:hypothetical protein
MSALPFIEARKAKIAVGICGRFSQDHKLIQPERYECNTYTGSVRDA